MNNVIAAIIVVVVILILSMGASFVIGMLTNNNNKITEFYDISMKLKEDCEKSLPRDQICLRKYVPQNK